MMIIIVPIISYLDSGRENKIIEEEEEEEVEREDGQIVVIGVV